MASNYDDVLHQLRAAGLVVDSLEVGKLRRVKVEGGDREKRGWYHLHELRLQNGDDLIVGSYGVWRGAENNAMKVEVKKSDLSREQVEAMRKRLAEDKKRAELARKAEQERAADKAAAAWRKCSPDGDNDYLHRKGVAAHGVRFSPQGAMVIPMLDVAAKIHGLQIPATSQTDSRSAEEYARWCIRRLEHAPCGHGFLGGGASSYDEESCRDHARQTRA